MQTDLRLRVAVPGLAALALVAAGNLCAPILAAGGDRSSGPPARPAVSHSVAGPAAADRGAPLELVPDRALLKAAVDDPGALVDVLLAQPTLKFVEALPGRSTGGLRKLQAGLDKVEARVGMPPRQLLQDLAGSGAVLWFDLAGFKPAWGLVLSQTDHDRSRLALDALLQGVAAEAGFPDAFEAPTAHRDGIDLWDIGDGELVVGWRDGRAMLAPTESAVRAALGADSTGAADRGHWRPAERPGALHVSIDMERVKLLAEFDRDGELDGLIDLADTPEGQLLFGPALSTVARGETVDLWLAADAGGLEVGLVSEGLDVVLPDPGRTAIAPTADDLLFAQLERRPGALVDGTLSLTDDANAQLAKGLSEIELLMGGLDLRRDVLPALGPTFQVIAREIPFESGPAPEMRLPAVALVTELGDGPGLSEALVGAFQNLVVLRNVDRTQKGEGVPIVIRRGEVTPERALSTAHYRRPLEGEPVDMLYNLAPACAAVDGWFVLASHEDLLTDLLDELPSAAAVADAGSHSERLILDGRRAVDLIASQRETLALILELRRGMSSARAGAAIDAVLLWLESQSRLTLSVAPVGEGVAFVARLEGPAE